MTSDFFTSLGILKHFLGRKVKIKKYFLERFLPESQHKGENSSCNRLFHFSKTKYFVSKYLAFFKFYIDLEKILSGLEQYFQQFILKSWQLSHFNLEMRWLPLRQENGSSTNHHEFETIKYSHTSGEQNLPFSISNNLRL